MVKAAVSDIIPVSLLLGINVPKLGRFQTEDRSILCTLVIKPWCVCACKLLLYLLYR